MSGNVLYGIGVGPGDPELLTLKAVRIMEESDVILLPGKERDNCVAYQIAVKAVPKLAQKEYRMISMPMTRDREVLEKAHQEGARQIEAYLDKGMSAAFLTLGDPCIYSTFSYLQGIIAGHGYQTELVSGIPSFCAAAAVLNEPLVVRDEPLHIIPASYPLAGLEQMDGTKVLMKSGRQMGRVKEVLREAGLSVKMVENCGMETERVYKKLEVIPDDSGYYSLIVARGEDGC